MERFVKYSKKLLCYCIAIGLLNLAGCSHFKKNLEEKTAATAYSNAKKLFNKRHYSEAGKAFEKIDEDFPFSDQGRNGQIMAIYSYFLAEEYDDVMKVTDYFLKFNPGSPDANYIYYIAARANFERISTITRGTDFAQKAFAGFRQVVARFPGSAYAFDAREKLIYIENFLAGSQLETARFYMRQKSYLSAIGRLNEMITRYENSNQVPEAYWRLAECYTALGVDDLAQSYLHKLKMEYPKTQWSRRAVYVIKFKGELY